MTAFPSRVDHADHLSTRQYALLVDEWVTAIGLRREDYGTHSLRRMKAAMIYKATGIFVRSSICSAIPKSRIRLGISAWILRMHLSWRCT